jgi:hypothetical protein
MSLNSMAIKQKYGYVGNYRNQTLKLILRAQKQHWLPDKLVLKYDDSQNIVLLENKM